MRSKETTSEGLVGDHVWIKELMSAHLQLGNEEYNLSIKTENL